MLPRPYLQCQGDGARVRPSWLEPRHDAWLRSVLEQLDACAGRTAAEVERRGEDVALGARRHGISAPAALGVWHVARQWATTVVASPVPPRALREEAFALAAHAGPDEAIATLVARLQAGADEVRAWLYADVPAARILRPKELPAPEALRDAYNMALAQGLVGCCLRVSVRADENLRAVVRAAKLRGLIVAVAADDPVLEASGPLALFRHTTKYARALATFIPSLVSITGWSLEGDLVMGETPRTLFLDAASPLPRTWALPQRADSALERALMKALRRAKSEWKVLREPVVLRAGSELFFPDFVLERGDDRVMVEVVGFWTPDYLERKMAQLATVTDAPLVVCVDETLACDPSRLPHASVVRFRRRMDPTALLAAAEGALAKRVAC